MRRLAAVALALGVLGVGTLTGGLQDSVARAVTATPWGDTGAAYDGGIVCDLPHDARIPLVAWSVAGRRAFAVTDVREVNGRYGPAPVSGAASQSGTLDAADAAALAYLLDHHGSGSAVEVAETSADVAAVAGDGTLQQRCLGQQGTDAQHAADLLAAARRYAGPYQVQVARAVSPRAGLPTAVAAQVLSAAGVGVPGIAVTFRIDGQHADATTGTDGTARIDVTAPERASTPVSASIAEPTGLTYLASDPATVALARPSTYTGAAALVVQHPQPTVRVDTGAGLLLASGRLAPGVVVAGTLGYRGSGVIEVHGPLRPDGALPCSGLDVTDLASAPAVWSGTYSVGGDGTYQAGRTPPLAAGCYAVTASVTLPTATPTATAAATPGADSVVVVSGLRLAETAGSGLARPGRLHATITGTSPGAAQVEASIVTYGPVVTADGSCADVRWAGADVSSDSTATALTAGPDGRLAARPATLPVRDPGCYALAARATVTLDGHRLRVDTPIGEKGTTVLVLTPVLGLTDRTTDGQQGQPMTGMLHVSGLYRRAGDVAVALLSAAPTITGCRGVRFAGPELRSPTAVLHISGDGDYRFRTPVAGRNRCYAVTATLAMSADHRVRFGPDRPTSRATFLAGIPLDTGSAPGLPRADSGVQRRTAVVLAAGMLAALLIALITMIAGYLGSDRYPAGLDPSAPL